MNIHESAALRRRLRVELRRARLAWGLTQKDIAERLDWSPSKIIRIESGSVSITVTDLRALLAEYGIEDTKVVEDLRVPGPGVQEATLEPVQGRPDPRHHPVLRLRVNGLANPQLPAHRHSRPVADRGVRPGHARGLPAA